MNRLLGLFVACCVLAGCHRSEAPTPPSTAKTSSKNTGRDTVVAKLGELSSKAPASWKEEKPSSMERIFQFKLPKHEGDAEDAELIVYDFGINTTYVSEYLKRWKGMFEPPAGKKIDDVSKVEKFKVGPANVTYLDVSGTFLAKSSPSDFKAKTDKKPDFRCLGVIFETPQEPYYLTVTGPARTVEDHKKSFDEWLKNFK